MKTFGKLEHGATLTAWMWKLTVTPDVAIRLKRIFPKAGQDRRGVLLLEDTEDTCRDIEWVLERYPLEVAEKDRDHLNRRAQEQREREETVLAILSGQRPHFEFTEPARPAREYQLVAADLALANGHLLLTDDLGLGKLMSGLLVLRHPDALPALIVCPTHLPKQWQNELALTLPWLRSHVVRTLDPYDPAKHRDCKGYDPDVLIVPYSKLRGWGDHLAGQVRSVIFDEAQELRRADSGGINGTMTAKYQAASQVADGCRYRVGLTATPVYNYGGEIHNILSVLSPDVLGSRLEFAREWCGGAYWNDKVAVQDPAALGTYLQSKGLMLRRTRKDVGRELPEVVRVPHAVDSDEDTFDALSAGARDLARLIVERDAPREEIWKASGELDWQLRRATGVAKAPYVAEFVRMLLETDEQVVLFGWHRDVYELWQQRLEQFNPAMYTGSESPRQKEQARERFLAGDARVLFMSLRSGAGLDGLQDVAHVAVFGELDWSPGMHEQCIGRLHRDGQNDAVVAYFLVSEQGSDPVMADVLNLKRQQSEPLRDPSLPLLEQAATDGTDRIKRLADEVLQRRTTGKKKPKPKRQQAGQAVLA